MSPAQGDADLTVVDYLLAIFCGLIGCIVSIVYIAQGKPKGTKMLIINIVAIVIWNVIVFAAQMMMGGFQQR
jgi:hypothetical protein